MRTPSVADTLPFVRIGSLCVVLALAACQPSGSSNSPNVIEQAAGDIEHEVDHAGDTTRQVGDDLEGGVDDVVDGASGTNDTAPPAEADDAEADDTEPES